MRKRFIFIGLVLALLLSQAATANPSYESSVRPMMTADNEHWCSAVAISQQPPIYLTAAHCYYINLTLNSGKALRVDGHLVTWVAANKELDLAAFTTDGHAIAIQLGQREPEAGDVVLVAGYPVLADGAYWQASAEIVETLVDLREFRASFGLEPVWPSVNLCKFPTEPGSTSGASGGAVIKDGKLVGIHVGYAADENDVMVRIGVSLDAIEKFLGLR